MSESYERNQSELMTVNTVNLTVSDVRFAHLCTLRKFTRSSVAFGGTILQGCICVSFENLRRFPSIFEGHKLFCFNMADNNFIGALKRPLMSRQTVSIATESKKVSLCLLVTVSVLLKVEQITLRYGMHRVLRH